MLSVEADVLTTLTLDRVHVLHGLKEHIVLGDDLRVLEKRGHEGGINALGRELCLVRMVLLLLCQGCDTNRRRDGGRARDVRKFSFTWFSKKRGAAAL